MMLRKEFIDAIIEEVKALLPEIEVSAQQTVKNNNVILNGIVLKKRDECIAPTIYIENYLDDANKDYVGQSKRIAECIVEAYKNEIKIPAEYGNVGEIVSDFSKVAPLLRLRLVNKENNAKLLINIPYIPFLDMAIIAVIELSKTDDGSAAIKVNKGLLEVWGFSALSDILNIARKNTFTVPYKFQAMADILAELSGLPREFFSGAVSTYVLSNQGNLNGATEICNYATMETIAEQLQSDLIVLPSSIHEVIIMPKDDGADVKQLIEMVKSINGNGVAADEVLSDHAYIFRRGFGWDY